MLDKITVVLIIGGIFVLIGFTSYAFKYITNKEYREKTKQKKKLSPEIQNIFNQIDYSYEEDDYNKLLNVELGQSLSESVLKINKSQKLTETDNFVQRNKMELTAFINIVFSRLKKNKIDAVLSKFDSENCLYIKSKLSDIEKFKDAYFTKYNYDDIKVAFIGVLIGERLIELIQKESDKIYNESKFEFQKSGLELNSIDTDFIKSILSDENYSESISNLLKSKSSPSYKYVSFKVWINLLQKSLNEKAQKLNDYFEYWKLDNI
ncbi:hypothetical protein [Flavobacterium sp. TBRC 19031]|uniref:hypothetical protein n=1 Tax=Flavobacterium mekongense TaxID=3379707 RepID=UPI00399B8530